MTDNDSTQLMPPNPDLYPLDADLAQAEETCPHCAAMIPAGEQFCGKCGYQRGTWATGETADSKEQETVDSPLFMLVGDAGEFGIAVGTVIIGRGEVDLQVGDGYMSRRHAEITATEEALTIMDLGSANGTFIDETQLDANEVHTVEPGHLLKFGQSEFQIVKVEVTEDLAEPVEELAQINDEESAVTEADDTEAVSADVVEKIQLDVAETELSGWTITGAGIEHRLAVGTTVFGRSAAKSDVQIDGDGFISGAHFKLIAGAEGLSITDVGSTNGTFIGDERLEINVEISLESAQKIRAGETELELTIAEGVDPAEELEQAETDTKETTTPEEG